MLCTPQQILFGMKWAGHVAQTGERRHACRILLEDPEGRRPLGRHRRIWEDNIKMDFSEVGWGENGLDQSETRESWRAFVNAVINL
jgi:hypothetical protein